MSDSPRWWHRWRINSEPIQMGGDTLTTECEVVLVGGQTWGWRWQRPTAILREHAGTVERYPIVDLYRLTQLALLLGIAGTLGIMMLVGKRGMQERIKYE